MDTTCVSCGEALVINRQIGAYQCVNSACGLYGGSVQTCEVCQRYSVTGEPPSCRNPQCAAFERQRSACPVCQRTALVAISGLTVCLNSNCMSHQGTRACWFCGDGRMSKVQHKSPLYTCRNPSCRMVLKLVRPCPVCHAHSFDLHQGRCLNPSCPTEGRRVSSCPSCGKKRFFGQSPTEKACANSHCALYFAPDPGSMPDGPAALPLGRPGGSSDSDALLEQAPTNPFGALDEDEPAPIGSDAGLGEEDEDGGDVVDVTMQMFSSDLGDLLRPGGGEGSGSQPGLPRAPESAHAASATWVQAVSASEARTHADEAPEPRHPAVAGPHGPHDDGARKPNGTAGNTVPYGHDHDDGATARPNAAESDNAHDSSAWDGGWRDTDDEAEPARIERIEPAAELADDAPELGVNVQASEPRMPATLGLGVQPDGMPASGFDSPPQPVDPASLTAGLSMFGNGGLGAMPPHPVTEETTDEEIEVEPDKIDFELAFRYLQRNFIKPAGQKPSPLYLVIGLSGVGKTCFLTMLGQVLLGTKFYTPRENIKPQIVKIDNRYRKYVRDLVYDFSSTRYDHFLSHGLWPPADIPGQTSEFLVTELLNREGEVARLATLEISGEVYQDFLPKVAEVYTDPTTLERFDPTHRIIWNLMQEAEGLVVLLEASSDWQTRTQMYTQFFQSLYQWKAVQVRDILVAQYEQFLQLDEKNYPLPLRIITGGMKKRASVDFDSFAGEVKMKVSQCLQTLDDHGINALFVNHFQTFEELRILYSLVDPENVPLQRLVKILESDPNYQDSNNQLQAFASFIKGLFNKFITDKPFLTDVYKKQTSDNYDVEDYWKIFQRYICWHYGLNEEELQLYDLTPSVDRSDEMQQRPFEKLKYLSIVFTKTDKDFAIYPASNFPKVVNVDWAAPLPRLGNYLTLCNGYLKYYNASVSGYSVRKDAGFQLGRRGTLTPINIAEPILDMLTFTGQPPLLGLGVGDDAGE